MSGKRWLWLCLMLVSLSLAVAGCGGEKKDAAGKGGPQGKVMIYTSIYPDIIESVKPAVKKAFGALDVQWFQGGTEKVMTKLSGEIQANKIAADLIMVADPSYYLTLKQRKLLFPYASPNNKGVTQAKGADGAMATDRDSDRVGVAVRKGAGKDELLTGNQIGSLLTEYRLSKCKELGWISKEGSDRVAIVKTYVTTSLQDAVGHAHGVKVINTLTGFKWIGAKIRGYEETLKGELLSKEGIALDYDATPFASRVKLLQKYSTFYAFGCEESYGYLANDYVRDKDANSACLMFAELCAYVKSRGMTVTQYLDEMYLKYGYFLEGTINIYYEGASGAAKTKRILDTYRSQSPKAFGDVAVAKFQDFGRETFKDADGEEIPKQDLYFVTLANGYTFAARGSGTEPKMKFYLFAKQAVKNAAELPAVKQSVKAELERIKALIEADAKARAEG